MTRNLDSLTTRRRFLASAGILGLAGCIAPTSSVDGPNRRETTDTADQQASDTSDDAWTMARCDAANTGFNPRSAAPTDPLEKAWQFPVDGNTLCAPVTDENTVYAGAGTELIAIDKATGDRRWNRDLGDTVGELSPLVARETVIVVGRSDGGDRLFALDRESGDSRWDVPLETTAPPVVSNERILLVETNGDSGRLRARSFDGISLWHQDLEESIHPQFYSQPAATDDGIFVSVTCERSNGSLSVRTSKHDVATGEEQWVDWSTGSTATAPTVAVGHVFVADRTGSVRSLDVESGAVRWEFDAAGAIHSSPAVAQGQVYTGTTGTFYALDAETGDEQWRTDVDIAYTDAAITVGQVVVGDGPIYGLSASDGTIEWVHDESGFSTTNYSPVLSDDAVFAGLCVKPEPNDMYENSIIKLT